MWVWKRFDAGEFEKLIIACGIEEKNREITERMVDVALSFVQYRPDSRPIMSDVVKMLEDSVEIPKPLNPYQPFMDGNFTSHTVQVPLTYTTDTNGSSDVETNPMNLNNSLEFYMRVDKLHQTPLRGNLTTHKRKKRENEGNMKKLGEEPMDKLQASTEDERICNKPNTEVDLELFLKLHMMNGTFPGLSVQASQTDANTSIDFSSSAMVTEPGIVNDSSMRNGKIELASTNGHE
ncbi:hypothetical protein JHK82_024105 [Glycine max]|nr:hypothetical protein JHK82_024105 [Glycine max]